jgi:hypothetical protein
MRESIAWHDITSSARRLDYTDQTCCADSDSGRLLSHFIIMLMIYSP